MIDQAGEASVGQQRHAVTRFVESYLPALRTYLVRRRGLSVEAADDLLQSFLAQKVLEQNLISRADRQRGKFRTFLLTSLDHFANSELRRARAKKRSGGEGVHQVPVDERVVDAGADPTGSFDVAWARQVIAHAVDMMEAQCRETGRLDIWGVFNDRILGPALRQEPAVDYETLVRRYQLQSPAQASNVLITAKRMFTRCLKAVVGQYAENGSAVEAEIAELHEILHRCA